MFDPILHRLQALRQQLQAHPSRELLWEIARELDKLQALLEELSKGDEVRQDHGQPEDGPPQPDPAG
jgi:uncharacterized coiled-coil protein SlyX